MTNGPLEIMLVLEATDGGTGRYLAQTTTLLCEMGHRVHVVCALRRNPAYRNTMKQMERAGAEVTEIDMGRDVRLLRDVRSIWRLRRLFGRIKVDIIHLHSSKAGALGRIAAALAARRPVVYSPHAYAFLDGPRRLRSRLVLLAERALARWTDHIVTVSDSERRLTIERRILPPGKVTTVANGIADFPADEFVTPLQRATVGASNRLKLGFMGRLEPQKAPETLLRTAAILQHRGVDFQLAIAGDGSLRASCEKLCLELGLMDSVTFLGHVDDASEFYGSIDAFVMTSRYEGLPYALLDAMAWALPVAAFDVDGVNDAVVDGCTGALAKPGDVEELAQYLERFAKEPEWRQSLGKAGRARVESTFQADRQVRQLDALYRRLSQRQDRRARSSKVAAEDRKSGEAEGLRVLFVSCYGLLGGAERSLIELIQALPRPGVVPMLACPPDGDLANAACSSGIEVCPLGLRSISRRPGLTTGLRLAINWFVILFKLSALIRKRGIHVVHANTTVAQIWAGPAARLARVPCVWHWRDFYDFPRLNRLLGRTADLSIAISRAVYDFAACQLGRPDSLCLVPNGLPHRLRPATAEPASWRRRLGIDVADIMVSMVAQPSPRKGHATLLRAMASLSKSESKVCAVLVYAEDEATAFPYLRSLKSMAHDLKCGGRVIFAGPCEDVPCLLAQSDVVVVPSLREPFGRVAIEAMLVERAVIASDVDGLAEIVEDGQTGILFPLGDWRRLADALRELATHPEERRRLAEAGRLRAVEHYNVERTAAGVLALYRRVVKSGAFP